MAILVSMVRNLSFGSLHGGGGGEANGHLIQGTPLSAGLMDHAGMDGPLDPVLKGVLLSSGKEGIGVVFLSEEVLGCCPPHKR